MDEWKRLEDFPDYEVSDHGHVRNRYSKRPLKPYIATNGFLAVTLRRDGRSHGRMIHLLVAREFVYPMPPYADTPGHRNRDPYDNRAVNLIWVPRWIALQGGWNGSVDWFNPDESSDHG